jgi:hypothetical protein
MDNLSIKKHLHALIDNMKEDDLISADVQYGYDVILDDEGFEKHEKNNTYRIVIEVNGGPKRETY